MAPTAPSGLDGPASKQAAGESAAYFMMLNPYIFSTGALSGFEAMSGQGCIYCDGIIDGAVQYQAPGWRRVGGQVLVDDVQVFDYEADEFAVALRLTQEPIRVVDAAGDPVDDAGRSSATAELHMVWTGAGWRVDAVDLSTLGES